MTNWIFLWESPDGERHWEAVRDKQTEGFLEKLLNEGIHPATVMCAYSPILFHWVWPQFHNGLSDVSFNKINKEIYGSEPTEKSKHKEPDVPIKKEPEPTKYGWISPDGRFFGCDYGGHSSLACKIVGEIEYVLNPEMYLEDLGWVRIFSGSINRHRYSVGMGLNKKLTDAQLKTLTSMGLDTAYGISCLL